MSWIDAKLKKPAKTDVGRGFICVFKPYRGKPYTGEAIWLGDRRPSSQWLSDWSGLVTHWQPLPDPPKGIKDNA